ncbi:MAG: hypothetical protein LLG01_14320 [Planctomycetaceae bacterium]|nr:hypothetical protein [Planctomycetaceae bacterium]
MHLRLFVSAMLCFGVGKAAIAQPTLSTQASQTSPATSKPASSNVPGTQMQGDLQQLRAADNHAMPSGQLAIAVKGDVTLNSGGNEDCGLVRVLIAWGWPTVVLIIAILFRGQIKDLLRRIEDLDAFGFKAKFKQQADQAKDMSQTVAEQHGGASENIITQRVQEIQMGLLQHVKEPLPVRLDFDSYKDMAKSQPGLALAGIRMDVEGMVRNFALLFQIDVQRRGPISRLLEILSDAQVIPRNTASLFRSVWSLCSEVIHGAKVDTDAAISVIDAAAGLGAFYVDVVQSEMNRRMK